LNKGESIMRNIEKHRPIYLSLTDKMDIMGVPTEYFKYISGIAALLWLFSRNWLFALIMYALMIFGAKIMSQQDMYNLDLFVNHFSGSDKYDA
jgi:Type IV secretory pathway, VirB3-like protein.